ncbi:hypothetical protein [Streptomyces sp. NPDC091268]|uniref:hypothetical protein n=1 Tax=Streptomyces sp. NPDC091268 TaxID=3365979 RepID=UPI00381B8245
MPEPLPRRVSLARLIEDRPAARIPWDAFAVPASTSETYGQPSPALMARAERGWKKLGAVHAHIGELEE